MALPEIGSRVLAYLPNLRRKLAITVTVHRGTKFWGVDDGGSRWAGLSQWELLADEDVTGEGAENSAGEDVTGEGAENSAGEDVTGEGAENSAGEDVTGEGAENSAGEDLSPSSDVVQVAIARITEHPDFQPRYCLDDFAIDRYVAMLSHSEPPPVELWWVENQLFLVHGHHRLSAARRAGRRHIPAIIRSGSRHDAIKAALLANLQNGLPLNRQSLERACKRYIELVPDETNRALARMFGLDEKTVRNYRKDLHCEALVSAWVPGETRLLYSSEGNVERRFCLATFKSRCFGGDDRWSVNVHFDSQQFYRNGSYPITSFSVVDDPLPELPDPATFSVGDRVWSLNYGYGFIFHDLPSPRDQEFCRSVGLSCQDDLRICFSPEWSGRLASVWSASLEFVASGKGLDLEQVLLSLRMAIAQISDDMPAADADRLHTYLNARIEWVRRLITGTDDSPSADDDADDADYLADADDDDADDADYLADADDDDADDADEVALFLDFLDMAAFRRRCRGYGIGRGGGFLGGWR